jgi:hypothetical protein
MIVFALFCFAFFAAVFAFLLRENLKSIFVEEIRKKKVRLKFLPLTYC